MPRCGRSGSSIAMGIPHRCAATFALNFNVDATSANCHCGLTVVEFIQNGNNCAALLFPLALLLAPDFTKVASFAWLVVFI